MRQALLTLALMLGIMLAGCSKDESSDMEQVQRLTKEQIVGVWRSGDYWVSFDGKGRQPIEGEPIEFGLPNFPAYYDGIYKAVLREGDGFNNDGGRYIIKGDDINIYNGSRGGSTKFVVTDIDDTSVSFIISFPSSAGEGEYTDTMTFRKASD